MQKGFDWVLGLLEKFISYFRKFGNPTTGYPFYAENVTIFVEACIVRMDEMTVLPFASFGSEASA